MKYFFLFFDYYYYLFNSMIYRNKKVESTYINTWIGISTMFLFNIIFLLFSFKIVVSIPEVLFIFSFILIVIYFFFIYSGRWKLIITKFTKKEPFPILGRVVYFLYIILSVVLVIYAAKLKREELKNDKAKEVVFRM